MMINEENSIEVIILSNEDISLQNELSTNICNTLIDIQMTLFYCFETKMKNCSYMNKNIAFLELLIKFLLYY
jgi:hypothetical protein